ncbi:MAG TPA: ABC transporter ATP-binding protein [Actinomycetota bacterium]|nr:ABC transporter ATP-binding protein [Actinomycetota bacterium]
MPDLVLRCTGLAKRFGDVVAVDGFELEVGDGELLCLLGPSGCGKTTALRLIAGLERPDAGTVEVAGRTVTGPQTWVAPERRRVGMVFQDWALFPHLDVRGNVAFGLDGETRTRVGELLELARLTGLEDRMPHQLSGGQQQRVALARALAPSPDVLLLDEPFSNLDAQLRAEVRSEVRRVLRSTGTTAVFVTHDQEEALSIADRLAVMIAGRVRRSGTPYEVYADPADVSVARLLGQTNLLPAQITRGVAMTALGELDVPDAPDGAAEVLVRPESLRATRDPIGEARIVNVEFYGHDQLLRCVLGDGTEVDVRLMGPHPELQVGTAVRLELIGAARILREEGADARLRTLATER